MKNAIPTVLGLTVLYLLGATKIQPASQPATRPLRAFNTPREVALEIPPDIVPNRMDEWTSLKRSIANKALDDKVAGGLAKFKLVIDEVVPKKVPSGEKSWEIRTRHQFVGQQEVVTTITCPEAMERQVATFNPGETISVIATIFLAQVIPLDKNSPNEYTASALVLELDNPTNITKLMSAQETAAREHTGQEPAPKH